MQFILSKEKLPSSKVVEKPIEIRGKNNLPEQSTSRRFTHKRPINKFKDAVIKASGTKGDTDTKVKSLQFQQ